MIPEPNMTALQAAVLGLIKIAVIIGVVLGVVAYSVWLERKVLARIQARFGPNRVGPFGLLQPVADGIKLFLKEDITPKECDRLIYYLAPILSMMPALTALAVIPFGPGFVLPEWVPIVGGLPLNWQIANPDIGIIFILAVASIGVYGIFMAGWSSQNKYSLIGALRSSAQMVSYELSLGLSLITVLVAAGNLNMREIVESQDHGFWNWWAFNHEILFLPGFIAFVLYVIAAFAETNRTPFDLPEAETELVAGYHTEYSSMKFAMFFMAEYTNMVVASSIATTLFLGGYKAPLPGLDFIPGVCWFAMKVFFFLFFFIWIRGTMPRLRYDQLMRFGWKFMLPAALANLVFISIVLLVLQSP